MNRLYKWLLCFVLLLPLSLQAQLDDPKLKMGLKALNKHVSFMDKADEDLMGLCLELIQLNEKMLAYLEGETNQRFITEYTFIPPEVLYKQASYQNNRIIASYQQKVQKGADSLIAVLQRIKAYHEGLQDYLRNKEYLLDGMYEGFEYMKKLDKSFDSYLVRHEGLYAHLLNAWNEFNPPKGEIHMARAIARMREEISKGHQVYVSLWYDPDMVYSRKSFAEFIEFQRGIQEKYANDSLIANSPTFQGFIRDWDPNFLNRLADKGTTNFYRTCNNLYVKDFNTRLVKKFNKFVREKNYPTLDASMLPAIFGAVAPPIELTPTKPEPIDSAIAITEDRGVPVETPKTDPKANTLREDTNPPEKPEVKPEKPEVKPVSLEGYASSNFVFLIDVSGSMRRKGRLDTLKSSFKYLLDAMRPEDKVSIVTYSGVAQVALPPTSATRKEQILRLINNLNTEGESNIEEGLKIALREVGKGFVEEGNNRIILATDGGVSIKPSAESYIRSEVTKGICLSIFFFGSPGNPNIPQLQRFTQIGKGNYVSIWDESAKDAMIREAKAVRQ